MTQQEFEDRTGKTVTSEVRTDRGYVYGRGEHGQGSVLYRV